MTNEAAREFVQTILNAGDPRDAIKLIADLERELPPHPTDTERAVSCLLSTSIALLHDRLLADLDMPSEMRTSLSLLWLARLGNAVPLLSAIIRVGHAVMNELGDEDLGGIGPEAQRDLDAFAPQIAALETIRRADRGLIMSHESHDAVDPPEEGPIDASFLQHLQEAEERGDAPPTEE